MQRHSTWLVAVLTLAACVSIPPPAAPVQRYLPELAGPFPPLEAGMGRVIIDARGASGEVVQLWVVQKVYDEQKLLCAKVPCMVDFKRLSTQLLEIRGWGLPEPKSYNDVEVKLRAEVPVSPSATGKVSILLVNVPRFNTSSGGPIDGKPSIEQFDASPEEAAHFLATSP